MTSQRSKTTSYKALIRNHPNFYDIIVKYGPNRLDEAQAHVSLLSQRAQSGIESVASTTDLTSKPTNPHKGRICTERASRVTGDPAARNHTYRGANKGMSGPSTSGR